MDKEKKTLNKPFRLPKGSNKKFGVYVKNDKGNVVMVKFGDPNMSIKRDDPERRKSYRARHNCDNPGPKWKANYWSCKMWSEKPVSKIVGSEEEFIDFDNLPSQDEILALDQNLKNVEEIEYEFSFSEVEYLDKEKLSEVKRVAEEKFGKNNSYVKNLFILKEYKKRGGKVKYSGEKPKKSKIEKQVKSSLEKNSIWLDGLLWNAIDN